MELKCLCCQKEMNVPEEVVSLMSFSQYSYCGECISKVMSGYISEQKKELPVLWYITDLTGTIQRNKEGKAFVWKDEDSAKEYMSKLCESLVGLGYASLVHTLRIGSFEDKGKFLDGSDYILFKE